MYSPEQGMKGIFVNSVSIFNVSKDLWNGCHFQTVGTPATVPPTLTLGPISGGGVVNFGAPRRDSAGLRRGMSSWGQTGERFPHLHDPNVLDRTVVSRATGRRSWPQSKIFALF